MNLLLDTHEFIWWAEQPQKLSRTIYDALHDKSNTLFLSIASIWEMQIKVQIGKMSFQNGLRRLVITQRRRNGLRILPVKPRHVYALQQLPFYHKDPFDRLIIAQAAVENFLLVSADPFVSAYAVNVLN